MFQLSNLLDELSHYLKKKDLQAIAKAYEVAEKAHEGQTRASGEPYITHPLEVARILGHMHLDAESIMAALLHDVIEDTPVEKNMLARKFGADVAELVDGVSKLTQIEFASRAEAQAENLRKMILAMVRDIRVILIKFADRLHNMRTLDALPPHKRQRIARETLDIYAPIANRLGMYKIKLEFEDLGFKAIHPLRYRILQHAVKNAFGNRQEIMHNIEHAIKQRLHERHMEHVSVHGREKHLYSIYLKMKLKHLAFTEIMDMYGFRVITQNVDDCYRALGVIHSLYKPLPNRFKDYIAIPKANNYQSLHTTLFGHYGVPIEIQIRTVEMDHLAENGIAANWIYKNRTSSAADAFNQAGPWLKSLEDIQNQAGNSMEFIENVKIDLFPDEVYVFTPKGTILELPAGATVVDFAYAVHTDIGDSCIAAKVNRQLAALNTQLENGQTVEIVTTSEARPNPAWLNFVVTGKARSHIRHFLKGQRRAESIALGQRMLDSALTALHLQMENIPEKTLTQLLQESGLETIELLYEEIGLGQRIAILEARRFAHALGQPASVEKIETAPLLIKGTEGLIVQFASCCRPIPGDSIVGYLQVGLGLFIHRDSCKIIAQYRENAEKRLAVEWEIAPKGEFSSELELELTNQRGMLALLAVGIADMSANIEDIKTVNRDGHHVQVNVVLSVHDRKHLARVIRRLRTIKGVLKIHRV